MPVLKLCARHRTLSIGRCPECIGDRKERRRVHVSAKGKKFRAEILERDTFVCHWCGGEAESVDYLRLSVTGGDLSTRQTRWPRVFGATFDGGGDYEPRGVSRVSGDVARE